MRHDGMNSDPMVTGICSDESISGSWSCCSRFGPVEIASCSWNGCSSTQGEFDVGRGRETDAGPEIAVYTTVFRMIKSMFSPRNSTICPCTVISSQEGDGDSHEASYSLVLRPEPRLTLLMRGSASRRISGLTKI